MAKKKAKRKAESEGHKVPSHPSVAKDIEDIFGEGRRSVEPSQENDHVVSRISPTSNGKTSTDVGTAIQTKIQAAKASSKQPHLHPVNRDDFSDLRGTKKRIAPHGLC